MSFFTLPNELIFAISTYLERESDLSALTQTSQHLHNLLTHDLYRSNIHRNGGAGLVRAAEIGHAGAVKRFLELGAETQADGKLQESRKLNPFSHCTGNALFIASAFGHTAIVTLLLSAGADPNHGSSAMSGMFYNPLYWAITKREVAVAEALLAHGVRFGHSTDEFTARHALHLASAYGPVEMVRLLLDYGADVEQLDIERHIPLYYAVNAEKYGPGEGHKRSEAEMADNMEIIKLLLEQEATYSSEDRYWMRQTAHHHWDARVRESFGFSERFMERGCLNSP